MKEYEEMIARICKMEQYYDILCDVVYEGQSSFLEYKYIQKMIHVLRGYVESGRWMKDFECDERGELPQELKRGVLSEDGLYNLLCDIEIKDDLCLIVEKIV